MLRFPREWQKLETTVVCDAKGVAHRHQVSPIEEFPFQEISMGHITVTDKTQWINLDRVIIKKFKKFIKKNRPYSTLGLTSAAIMCYKVGDGKRDPRVLSLPAKAPFAYVTDNNIKVRIYLKGAKQQGAIDALVFQTQLCRDAMNIHVQLILSRGLIIFHSSRHLQSYLDVELVVQRIAEYIDNLPSLNRQRLSPDEVAAFTCTGDMDNIEDLRTFIDTMEDSCLQVVKRNEALGREGLYYPPVIIPHVIIVENLQTLTTDLTEIIDGFSHFRRRIMEIPYLLGTYLCEDMNC